MNNSGERPNRPDEVDAAFQAIVADLRTSDDTPEWPDDRSINHVAEQSDTAEKGELSEAELDDEHYVAPEPPPLPILRRSTVIGLVVIALGIATLVSHYVINISTTTAFIGGLLIISAGFAWLVYHMQQDPPPDSGWDDGARV